MRGNTLFTLFLFDNNVVTLVVYGNAIYGSFVFLNTDTDGEICC